ncbi:CHAT domain-containing protein [Cyathus striatus]|nr:CHAT domain-containing protein [Cyathus striatus]
MTVILTDYRNLISAKAEMEREITPEDKLKFILANSNLSPISKGEELLGHGIKLTDEFRESGEIKKLQSAVEFFEKSLAIMPNDGTRVRNNLAIALNLRFEELGVEDDFECSMRLHEDALSFFEHEDEKNHTDDSIQGYIDKGSTLNHLANRLRKKFDTTGQNEYLFAAIKLDEESLLLHPPEHKHRAHSLDSLADKLSKKFAVFSFEEDLNYAINLHKEALALEPLGDKGRMVTLNQLGNALGTRYEKYGNENDMNTAIECLEEALSLFPLKHKDRKSALNNVAAALLRRFQKTGSLQDSTNAIALLEEGLSYLHSSHPTRMFFLHNLAGALILKFESFGERCDLDKAIELYEEALCLQSPAQENRADSLHELSSRLISRFKTFGDINFIERAIKYDNEALELSYPSHINRAYSLGTLAEKLSVRFHATGQQEDLKSAIDIHQEALSLLPAGHSYQEMILHNLATEYAIRFETFGQEDDLATAISIIEKVILLRPVGHQFRGCSLTILGRLLMLRFDMLGYDEDLDGSIKVNMEALSLHWKGHVDRDASLNNLANALTTSFEVFHKSDHLDIAILLNKEALSLQPSGHWNRRISLNNLAGGLSQRFSISGNADDLEAALSLQEEALQIDRSENQVSIYNYAQLLSKKYQKFGNFDDLNHAISMYQEALNTVFKDSSFRAQCMLCLGIALITRFEYLQPDKEGFEEIIALFAELSSMTTQFTIAFRGAQIWATFASKYDYYGMASKAYRAAINLLPLLVPITFEASSRTRNLFHLKVGFVANAAAQSIHAMKSYSAAIELLEAGRSVFWSQAINSSPDINHLLSVAPDLGRQLQSYSKELTKKGEDALNTESDYYISEFKVNKRNVSNLKALQDNWLHTLGQIRGIQGFEDFLKPLSISKLSVAKSQGIIVILNVTEIKCDALIMTPQENDILHVQFPDINLHIINAIAELLRYVVGSGNRDSSNINIHIDSLGKFVKLNMPVSFPRYGKKWNFRSNEMSLTFLFPAILKFIWDNIALPIIQALKLQKSTCPPRLWWCPTGPFTFLPLHAAGNYIDGSIHPEDSLSNYVISSYTSTVTALLSERVKMGTEDISEFKLVGVADTKNLFKTEEEIQKIQQYIPLKHIVELGTRYNPPASIEEVDGDPLQSGLQLGNGEYLNMAKIMQLSIPNASLAFLSACETAMGDEKLPDEALHIGTSLVFAGFKSIIATLWKIEDEDGPIIADIFYKNLFKHVDFTSVPVKGFDPTNSAESLHYAVKQMQECGIPPHRWAPFIHIGK